jgi:UDP-GlcNAc:undecaprenyl-phosphate GlcNAc-1-phosphate transferase
MTDNRLEMFVRSLPLQSADRYLLLLIRGYRGVWRYVGIGDLLRYAKVTLGSVLLVALIDLLLFSGSPAFTPVLFILFAVYLFLGLAASRSSFKILDELSSRQTRPHEERVIIYGAGDAGEMALRWILMNPQLSYRPVGFSTTILLR